MSHSNRLKILAKKERKIQTIFLHFTQIYLRKNKCKMIKEKELSHLKEWFGERFNWRIVWWSIRRNEGAMENFLFVTSQNVEGIISS